MTLTPLVTAAEAYPALERLVTSARSSLCLSFRIIDPTTRLTDPELRANGLETWADLIADSSRRGIQIRLLVADFDPLFAPELHRNAWLNASGFADVVTGDAQVLCAPHGQKAGRLWHLAMAKTIKSHLAKLKTLDPGRLTPVQRDTLVKGPVLRPATLHQKFAIADGVRAVIGGIDIDERRYDTPLHDRAPRETWHDVSVGVDDAAFCAALHSHFAECWNAALDAGAASLADPPARFDTSQRPQSPADHRLLRTFATPSKGLIRLGPKPRNLDHETTLKRLFASAQSSLYIETQFFRDVALTKALAEAATLSPDLNVMLLVPAAPERVLFDGADSWDARHETGLQAQAINTLRAAFGGRLAVLCPTQPRAATEDAPSVAGAGPIYLHSKLTIADGAQTVIGSANLNGRSMRWDTEASILIRDAAFSQDLATRMGQHWLRDAAESADLTKAETWTRIVTEDSTREPHLRTTRLALFPLERTERFARHFPGLPNEMF